MGRSYGRARYEGRSKQDLRCIESSWICQVHRVGVMACMKDEGEGRALPKSGDGSLLQGNGESRADIDGEQRGDRRRRSTNRPPLFTPAGVHRHNSHQYYFVRIRYHDSLIVQDCLLATHTPGDTQRRVPFKTIPHMLSLDTCRASPRVTFNEADAYTTKQLIHKMVV